MKVFFYLPSNTVSADSVTLLHCRNLRSKSGQQQRSRMTSKLRPAQSRPAAVNLRIPLSCDIKSLHAIWCLCLNSLLSLYLSRKKGLCYGCTYRTLWQCNLKLLRSDLNLETIIWEIAAFVSCVNFWMNWRKTQRVPKLRCLAPSDVLCHIQQGGATADSADCCMISLETAQSRRRALCTFPASHHRTSTAPSLIGGQPLYSSLIGCWDHCRLHLSGSAAEPGPVLCFAKQKTCPCQSLDNSSAPTNRRLWHSSMDKLEARGS